jgi:hypothetical protein
MSKRSSFEPERSRAFFTRYYDPRTGRDSRLPELLNHIHELEQSGDDHTRCLCEELRSGILSNEIDYDDGCEQFGWIWEDERERNPKIPDDDPLMASLIHLRKICEDDELKESLDWLEAAIKKREIDYDDFRERLGDLWGAYEDDVQR